MKRYEKHAQFVFYLQTLNEHELVPELFEQAKPCMNWNRKIFIYRCFSHFLFRQELIQEMLLT